MTEFDKTIDWNRYWDGELTTFDEEWKTSFAHRLADMLGELFDTVDGVDRVASVGCGPATTLLDLAECRPEVELYGYDPAAAALEQARKRAADRGVSNVVFREARLPELDVNRTFDVVYCLNTLHYVAEIETAIGSLFDVVRPGGLLVFTYPTEEDQAWLREELEDPDETLTGDHGSDWLRRRFQLAISGRNLVDQGDLERILDREVNHVVDFGITPPEVYGERIPHAVVRK